MINPVIENQFDFSFLAEEQLLDGKKLVAFRVYFDAK